MHHIAKSVFAAILAVVLDQIVGEPTITGISPMSSPLVGGVRITLIGENFINPVIIRLGNGPLFCRHDYTVNKPINKVVQIVPAVDSSFDGRQLMIYVKFNSSAMVTTGAYFTYKAAAKVTNIWPLEAHAKGGTRLTVTGEHLDTVKTATLYVRMEHAETEKVIASETYLSTCFTANSSVLFCNAPAVTLPVPFINWNQGSAPVPWRRTSGIPGVVVHSNLTISLGNQTLDFFMELELDGARYFKMLVEDLELRAQAKMIYFDFNEDIGDLVETIDETYEPFSEVNLTIKGNFSIPGIHPSDYSVFIGDFVCTLLSVHPGEITFTPPDQFPLDPHTFGGYEASDVIRERLNISLHAANLQTPAGYVTYNVTYADAVKYRLMPEPTSGWIELTGEEVEGGEEKQSHTPHVLAVKLPYFIILLAIACVLSFAAVILVGVFVVQRKRDQVHAKKKYTTSLISVTQYYRRTTI